MMSDGIYSGDSARITIQYQMFSAFNNSYICNEQNAFHRCFFKEGVDYDDDDEDDDDDEE